MLKWKIEHGVVSKLFIDNVNYINPWGAETADSSAFFSLEEGVGYRYKYLKRKHDFNESKNTHSLKIEMKEGIWNLDTVDEIIDDNLVRRSMELNCIEESYLMDFVLRYRFLKEHFEYAEIDNKKFFHKDTNIYHQFPVDTVFLKGKKKSINIKINECHSHENFRPEMYVRDRGDEWIVHVRMFPKKSDKDVIKLCSEIFKTRPLPEFVTKLILLSKNLKEKIWYRGEKSPYSSKVLRAINPNGFALVKISAGEKLSWNVDMEVL